MRPLIRFRIPAALLGVVLGVTALAAAGPSAADDAAAGSAASAHHDRGYPRLLRQLALTPEQQSQVRAITAQAKPQWTALRSRRQSNRAALATTAPTDPGYPALLAAAEADAAASVRLGSETWGQIYAVLTPGQQAQLPALVAAAQEHAAARRTAWQSRHTSG